MFTMGSVRLANGKGTLLRNCVLGSRADRSDRHHREGFEPPQGSDFPASERIRDNRLPKQRWIPVGLIDLNDDVCKTSSQNPESFRSHMGQIDDPTFSKGAAVIHTNHYGGALRRTVDLQQRAERVCSMRTGHAVRMEPFAAGSLTSLEGCCIEGGLSCLHLTQADTGKDNQEPDHPCKCNLHP